MRWTVLGASAVRPNPGGACSGYLLETDEGAYLVDCGPGVISRLLLHRPLRELAGVLISHGHADHCLELVTLRLALRYTPVPERRVGLPLHIPPGMDRQLEALGAVFHDDMGTDPHEDYWLPVLERRTYDPAAPLELPGVTVTFARTNHYVPCWAMRFTDARGRVLVYGADGGPCDAVTDLASGADLLVLESAFPRRAGHEGDLGHLAPEEAGAVAAAAGARRLVLTHTFSAYDRAAMCAAAAGACDVPVEVASEGRSWSV
ncbi:MAG: MBL fold metallo-hydrolase [Ardenticatenales bacterium]